MMFKEALFDGTEVFRSKVDVCRCEVFFKPMQLGCTRNGNNGSGEGSRSVATLVIVHDGTNSPQRVELSGEYPIQ